MPKLTIDGVNDFVLRAERMANGFNAVASAALYAGAGVVADAIKAEIRNLPEQKGYLKDGERRNEVTPDEKQDLIKGVGIAHFKRENGNIDTAVGFDGYSRHETEKYPNGVPLPLIARSIESGSSVRQKHPIFRKVAKSCESAAKAAMEEAARKKFEELSK